MKNKKNQDHKNLQRASMHPAINSYDISFKLGPGLIKGRRGQVTAFIILGLFIVAVILVVLWLRPKTGGDGGATENPNSFLNVCLKDSIIEAVNEISDHGGYADPELKVVFAFEGEPPSDIGYLCYQGADYLSCVNQNPMFFNHLESEIGEYISGDVRGCFDDLGASFEEKGYAVDAVYRGFEVNLDRGKIEVDINAEITLTNSDGTAKESSFLVIVPSDFYDLSIVVQKIVSREAKNCDFDFVKYMKFYPEYQVEMKKTLDLSKIYVVTSRETQESFRFAIRGCVNPGGYF